MTSEDNELGLEGQFASSLQREGSKLGTTSNPPAHIGGDKVENPVSMGVRPWLNPVVDDEPMQLPIDGVLDLHTFQPREVRSLVLDYLAECRTRGILRVRIIHGKGIGQLRQTVQKLLERHPDVVSFNLAHEHFGGWGATIVHLQPPLPEP
jgi:hypothetical protein